MHIWQIAPAPACRWFVVLCSGVSFLAALSPGKQPKTSSTTALRARVSARTFPSSSTKISPRAILVYAGGPLRAGRLCSSGCLRRC